MSDRLEGEGGGEERTGGRSTRWWFGAALSLNIAVILVAVLLGMFKYSEASGKATPTRYFGEGKFPTLVSIVQLAAVGGLCFAVWRFRRRAQPASFSSATGIWLMMAAGFVFLALDEWLEIHESLDHWLHKNVLGHEATNLTDRIDDVILLGYGLIGLAVLWVYRREIARFAGALPYVVFSGICSVLSVAMDVLTNKEDLVQGALHTWMTVGDDAFKLLAEAGFIGAAVFACRHGRRGGASSPEGSC